jgi:hypothetical protein
MAHETYGFWRTPGCKTYTASDALSGHLRSMSLTVCEHSGTIISVIAAILRNCEVSAFLPAACRCTPVACAGDDRTGERGPQWAGNSTRGHRRRGRPRHPASNPAAHFRSHRDGMATPMTSGTSDGNRPLLSAACGRRARRRCPAQSSSHDAPLHTARSTKSAPLRRSALAKPPGGPVASELGERHQPVLQRPEQ